MSNHKQHITSIDDDADEDQFGEDEDTKPHPASKAHAKRSSKDMHSISLPGASGERKIITIHHGEGKLGASAAFVAVNSHSFHIPRGVKVNIPMEIVDALNNAVNILYEQVDNKMLPREVRRFPFSEHVS